MELEFSLPKIIVAFCWFKSETKSKLSLLWNKKLHGWTITNFIFTAKSIGCSTLKDNIKLREVKLVVLIIIPKVYKGRILMSL